MAAARRGFLKAVAIAPLVPVSSMASPQASPPSQPGADVAEALAEAARREHALDAAAVAEVRKQIARSLEGAARLRAAAGLANDDAPVTRFSASLDAAERQ